MKPNLLRIESENPDWSIASRGDGISHIVESKRCLDDQADDRPVPQTKSLFCKIVGIRSSDSLFCAYACCDDTTTRAVDEWTFFTLCENRERERD